MNKPKTFEDFFAEIGGDKRELAEKLKTMEAEGQLIYYKNYYYDPKTLEVKTGWVSPGAKSGVFFTENKPHLELGANYNLTGELSIANRKNAWPGSEVVCYLVEDGAYIKETVKVVDFDFVGYVSNGSVQALMRGFELSFPTTAADNTWGHFSYKSGAVELVKTICERGSKEDYADIGSYILNFNPVSQVSVPATAQVLEYRDMTTMPFYTIDALTTKDIDDAIYFDGQTLYVAIADASAVVDSALDSKAQTKTSSFYLPNRVEHMLPRDVAEAQLSLVAGAERRVMVCEIGATTSFYPAIIKTSARLTYEDVDRILVGAAPVESIWVDSRDKILESLMMLSKKPVTVEDPVHRVPRVEYQMGESGRATALYLDDRDSPAQKMVEFAMVSANVAAAEFIDKNYQGVALFRNQLEVDGVLESAQYAAVVTGHASLAAEHYTHFTSPIRRYCDLVVHRIIKDILTGEHQYSDDALGAIADNLNVMQKKMKSVDQKLSSMVINDYIASLNQRDFVCRLVDFTATGAVFRDAQNIEFFIPAFKVDYKLGEKLHEFLTSHPDRPAGPMKEFLATLPEYTLELIALDAITDKKLAAHKRVFKPRSEFDANRAKIKNEIDNGARLSKGRIPR